MWGRHEHWPDAEEQLEERSRVSCAHHLQRNHWTRLYMCHSTLNGMKYSGRVFLFPPENKFMEKILPMNESQILKLKAPHDFVVHGYLPCPLFTVLHPHHVGVSAGSTSVLALVFCNFCRISNSNSFPGPWSKKDSSNLAVPEANHRSKRAALNPSYVLYWGEESATHWLNQVRNLEVILWIPSSYPIRNQLLWLHFLASCESFLPFHGLYYVFLPSLSVKAFSPLIGILVASLSTSQIKLPPPQCCPNEPF